MAKSSASTKPRISVRETFSALQHRNYRIWFIGQLISLIGTWMQATAQQYLIYDITNSTILLGFVTFMAGVPTLVLTLLGGVIADRFSRRNLMVITQACMMVLAFILAGLVFLHVIQYWHIIIMATLLGIANAIEAPVRQTFVIELVDDRKDISNAIAMNATQFNMAVVIGPAVSGIVYFLVGPGWCFIINGFSFVAVIIALLMMRIPPIKKLETHSNIFRDIGEGIRYVFAKPQILWLIITLGMVSLIGFGFIAQSPAWAKSVLLGDERTNGWMLTIRGVGSLIGALVVAALGRRKIHGKLWSIGSIMLPAVVLLFAIIPWLPVSNVWMVAGSYIMLIFAGISLMLITNTSNAMVQTRSSDQFRGRVMGLYTLIFLGGMPIGSLIIGALAAGVGLPLTILIGAVILILFMVLVWLLKPQIRKLE